MMTLSILHNHTQHIDTQQSNQNSCHTQYNDTQHNPTKATTFSSVENCFNCSKMILKVTEVSKYRLKLKKKQGPYSQHFILHVTNEWAQQARVLHYTSLEKPARDKCSSLLAHSYVKRENEVL